MLPTHSFIPAKEIHDFKGVESLEHSSVPLDDVVDTDESQGDEPRQKYRCE